jgi:hypothetical protein
MIQMELFGENDFSVETGVKEVAKKYTAEKIYKCSGIRGAINHYLDSGDEIGAFRRFEDAFRNFGFGTSEYSFSGANGMGEIKVVGKFTFNVSPKEVFKVFLECYET